LKQRQPRLLDVGGIVVVHHVNPDHGIASPKQAGCYMEADKSGIACHQRSHFLHQLSVVWLLGLNDA
jgi:hypothetical protein